MSLALDSLLQWENVHNGASIWASVSYAGLYQHGTFTFGGFQKPEGCFHFLTSCKCPVVDKTALSHFSVGLEVCGDNFILRTKGKNSYQPGPLLIFLNFQTKLLISTA